MSSPKARSQMTYEDWNVPFVASWNYNNWVIKYCLPKENELLDEWWCITVSPVDWSSFYQNEPFLWRWWAGSSIIILRNNNLNKNCWLFMASIMRKSCNFSYDDMWNKEKIKNVDIKLPVDSNWNIDWNYMDNFMENKKSIVKEYLSSFF